MVSTSKEIEPEQLTLFDTGVDMQRLRKMATSITKHARAANTARAYDSDWRAFVAWCDTAGRAPLPASQDTLTLYLTSQLQTQSIATVERGIHGIVATHRLSGQKSPYRDDVRDFMKGARRHFGRPPKGRAALSVQQLRDITRALAKMRTVSAVRNQAMIVLGFACGMRASELCALQIADIAFTPRGIRVTVSRSKTDQEAKGRDIGIFAGTRATTCPVKTLKQWLYVRGKAPGPLFTHTHTSATANAATIKSLTPRWLCQIVKDCVTLIGDDAAQFGAHSLRAGCVTAAIEAGVPESLVMQRTGHRTISVIARYVRPARLFSTDVLAGAL